MSRKNNLMNQKITALYCRISLDDGSQNESMSISNQKILEIHFLPYLALQVREGRLRSARIAVRRYLPAVNFVKIAAKRLVVPVRIRSRSKMHLKKLPSI